MKIKTLTFIAVTLCSGLNVYASENGFETSQNHVACPKRLKELLALPDNTTTLDLSELNIVHDEIAPYDTETNSVTSLINQIKRMEEEDRKKIETINIRSSLLGRSGFKTFMEGIIPLFSSLKVLNLGCDGIGKENEEILLKVLSQYPTIHYINIVSNELARQLRADIVNKITGEDRKNVLQKVIVSHESIIDQLPKEFPEWKQTHQNFYKSQEVH